MFAALVVLAFSACRSRSSRNQVPVVEEPVEYHPLVTDSAAIDSIANAGVVDVDADPGMEYPEMPVESEIDMNATDDALMDIVTGSGDGEIAN